MGNLNLDNLKGLQMVNAQTESSFDRTSSSSQFNQEVHDSLSKKMKIEKKEISVSGKKPFLNLTKVGNELILHDRYRCKILQEQQFDGSSLDGGPPAHKSLLALIEKGDVVYLSVQQKEQVIVFVTG